MLPEFPPSAAPEPPPPPPWRFWPDFWKGFGLCLLLCVVIGTAFLLVVGVSFKVAEPLGSLAMVVSPLVGLLPLTLITILAFRRRPSGQRIGWIIGGVICYAFMTLTPLVICFGVLIAAGMK
ncbi:MAG: hypothetical protein IPL96_05610 [Holophagaceae bacterium]|nr:hypothetical protein [Holophagaceae bacterium]